MGRYVKLGEGNRVVAPKFSDSFILFIPTSRGGGSVFAHLIDTVPVVTSLILFSRNQGRQ